MKKTIQSLLVLAVAVCMASAVCLAQSGGEATYKAKCAMCHGPEGQGKVGPKLAGTTLTAGQIADLLTKGNDAKKAPHKKPVALSADEAKAVATFVTTLK